jgi:HlyD family secretion protein
MGKPAAQPAPANAVEREAAPTAVGCAGRVEPAGGIITIAASPELGRTPVIAKLLVDEGQMVTPGQAIAVLDSAPDLEAAVRQAEARLAVAEEQLAQLQAGARTGDVRAQRSEIARLEADSKAAREELERKQALAAKDFVAPVQVDAARLKAEETEHSLDTARARLESLTEVRESDLHLATAEVAAARADLERSRIQQEAGTIRAPQRGRVIQLMARAGEAVGPEGVVTLADTSHMDVVAEVYETDIARVHPGQNAQVTADWLGTPLKGVVRMLSPEIARRSLPLEPTAPADQRVYAVRIRMSQPELLAQRLNAKVNVRIEP